MSNSTEDIDRVWSLTKEIAVAMVVTHSGDGRDMRARPMAARCAREQGAIYFLTDVDAPKDSEVEGSDSVCLTLADNASRKYLSISGHAEIIDDRELVKQVWSIYDKVFWRDENDPRIRVLRVTPMSAEFWEGDRTVVTAVKLVVASVLGERMSTHKNEKVGFDS